ncbi:chromobox protein homolog 1-like [Tetranychus urticae]|uniref:Chromo domain-containing protein n=1 Tax=Tetranychus urticae TaxID=32264 RepID=T1KTC3_TETUR|nr:chromobox protein homolog 1-like [Tetranychus urticae]
MSVFIDFKPPDESEEYEVEKIYDKRTREGRVEYFLKWVGYPESANTWERLENLNCPALVAEFEEGRLKKKKRDQLRQTRGRPQSPVKNGVCGIENGFEVERIIGATDVHGELEFLIKWKESPLAELVKASIANEKLPAAVIAFYEARLVTRFSKSESNKDVKKFKLANNGRNLNSVSDDDSLNGDSMETDTAITAGTSTNEASI